MSIAKTALLTAEDLFAMDSDAPYELIDGELREVTGSAHRSSAVAANILFSLMTYTRPRKLGVVTGEAAGFILSRNPDTVVAPDVAYIRRERLPGGNSPDFFSENPPDLAVEVMSPSDRLATAERKVRRYLDAGTMLVWLVKPKSRSVAVYRQGAAPIEVGPGGELDGADVLPGFRLPLSEIFE